MKDLVQISSPFSSLKWNISSRGRFSIRRHALACHALPVANKTSPALPEPANITNLQGKQVCSSNKNPATFSAFQAILLLNKYPP